MSASVWGRIDWGVSHDKDGYRDYYVRWLVASTSVADGPGVVMGASGLPAIGAPWGYGNDSDPWSFCRPTAKATPIITREPGHWWIVENNFSNRPLERCQDASIDNPVNEPVNISGSYVKHLKEAQQDRHGDPIRNSAFELITGAPVEFDENRPSVVLEYNTLASPVGSLTEFMDCVNDSTMWGLGARKIKFSSLTYQRKLYGVCNFYYTIRAECEIKDDDVGFDRKILDKGTKVLRPGGDPTNPQHFQRAKDALDNPLPFVFLNGNGKAIGPGQEPAEIDVEYYDEKNLLLAGFPASI